MKHNTVQIVHAFQEPKFEMKTAIEERFIIVSDYTKHYRNFTHKTENIKCKRNFDIKELLIL